MELEEKKKHVLRCIKLGMDLYSSQIIAQCTTVEMEQLVSDNDFNNEVLFNQKKQELDLLTYHDEASIVAGLKGNTHGFEWMLEKINPSRFGRGQNENDQSNIPKMIVLMGKYPEGEDASNSSNPTD